MDIESLLKEARNRYPKCTKYISITYENICIVKGNFQYFTLGKQISDGYGGSVYLDGKWAKIHTQVKNYELWI